MTMVDVEAVRPGRRAPAIRLSKAILLRTTLAAAALASAFTWVQWWDFVTPSFFAAPYQAVFLVNGQTYFGRYHDRLGPFAKLEDVYYVQQIPSADQQQAPEQRIVRRGGELHAPRDRILIPYEAILFVEDLRLDSAIRRFIERNEAAR